MNIEQEIRPTGREAAKAEFAEHDKRRQAVLRGRGLRESVRPWAATNHVVHYRQKFFPFQTLKFHQGARVRA